MTIVNYTNFTNFGGYLDNLNTLTNDTFFVFLILSLFLILLILISVANGLETGLLFSSWISALLGSLLMIGGWINPIVIWSLFAIGLFTIIFIFVSGRQD